MANEYYDHTTYPSNGAALSSSALRSELNTIELGFDKLPTMTGNGGKIVAVNAGETALESIATTGTGNAVRATSPTLVTPILGTPTSGTLTNCAGLPADGVTGTALVSAAIGTTVQAYSANLDEYAAVNPTAAGLALLDDATAAAQLVTLGAAALAGSASQAFSAASINKMAITAPATSSTLAVADGKTFTVNGTLTLAGTDGTTMTFPATSASVARTDAAQTFTGLQTFATISATGAYSNTNTTAGQFNLGTAGFTDGIANIFANVSTTNFVAMKTSADGTGGTYLTFENAAGSVIGTIKQASSSTTAYNTSSDAHLKEDLGVAVSTTVLKNTVVHDHKWKKTGEIDRNVFAQEAYLVKPAAVSPGTDELTESGDLKNPWSVDYSKYVCELIVGWQAHEAMIAKLEARIAAIGG